MLTSTAEAGNKVPRPTKTVPERFVLREALPDGHVFVVATCPMQLRVAIDLSVSSSGHSAGRTRALSISISIRLAFPDANHSRRFKLRPRPHQQIQAQHGPPRRRHACAIRRSDVGARHVQGLF